MTLKIKYFLLLLLFLPSNAWAHGLVTTLSKTTGEYKIEFEYNTFGSIFVGDYMVYDTYLLKAADSQPVDFDSAFIRIEKKNGLGILGGSLAESKDKKGFASLSGAISEAGSYTADVSFYQAGKRLAGSTFDFDVKEHKAVPGSKPVSKGLLIDTGLFITGLIIGVGGVLWLKSKKRA